MAEKTVNVVLQRKKNVGNLSMAEADRKGRFRHVSPFTMDWIFGDIRGLTPKIKERFS